jgi:hypothetical protein
MNFRYEMFKYQEIQTTANKIGEDCISQIIGH